MVEGKKRDGKLQLGIENVCTKAEREGFERGKKESQAEVLKEIEELECMHVIDKALEKEDYSGEQEEAFEYGWTEALNLLEKRLLAKSEAKKK